MTLRETPIAPVPRPRGPLRPITRLSIQRIVTRSVAVFSVVFGAQAVPFALAQQDLLVQPWGGTLTILIFTSLLATAVAGFAAHPFATIVISSVPMLFLVALLTWPLSVQDPALAAPAPPWLWYICNIALAAAVVAFSPTVAAIYLVVVPTVYLAVRLTPSGGSATLGQAALDSVFTAILGAAILILAELLRRAAGDVDAAQSGAVSRYASAVREHATEVERMQVDSILHDGVLTALLSAGRALTAEERGLAVAMARASMTRLSSAAHSPMTGVGTVTLREVRDRLEQGLVHLDPDAAISPADLAGDLELPADIGQSLGDAALQALVNSRQHAGDGAMRQVAVRARDGVAEIVVRDDGRGFDTAVRSERLGVRVSILERVAAVGGRADVESSPGAGTTVTLRWPQTAPEELVETVPSAEAATRPGADRRRDGDARSAR